MPELETETEVEQEDTVLAEAIDAGRIAFRAHEDAKETTIAATQRVKAIGLQVEDFNSRLRDLSRQSIQLRTEVYRSLIETGADANIGKQSTVLEDLRRKATLLADAVSIAVGIEKPLAQFQQLEAKIRETLAESELFNAAAGIERIKRGRVLLELMAQEGILPTAALQSGKTASMELRALDLKVEAGELKEQRVLSASLRDEALAV